MISVIVPVYNVEPYLRECIESILGQTYRDFELILVNDGSTDDSGTICDEYAAQDTRIRVLHQKNSGVSVARNVGLDSVQGEYIAFVDSDDRVSKDYLAYLNDLIQIECADIACCDFLQNHPIEFSDIEKDELVYDTLTGANSCLRLYQQNGKIYI